MMTRDLERHPGITMHRIAVGGTLMGALFAVGIVLIFVIGVPYGDWFVIASILVGTCVSVALYAWHEKHPVELVDLHHPAHVARAPSPASPKTPSSFDVPDKSI
jgi:hypothetical protein